MADPPRRSVPEHPPGLAQTPIGQMSPESQVALLARIHDTIEDLEDKLDPGHGLPPNSVPVTPSRIIHSEGPSLIPCEGKFGNQPLPQQLLDHLTSEVNASSAAARAAARAAAKAAAENSFLEANADITVLYNQHGGFEGSDHEYDGDFEEDAGEDHAEAKNAPPEKVTAHILKYRREFEAARSFDIEDDIAFCPHHLLNEEDLKLVQHTRKRSAFADAMKTISDHGSRHGTPTPDVHHPVSIQLNASIFSSNLVY